MKAATMLILVWIVAAFVQLSDGVSAMDIYSSDTFFYGAGLPFLNSISPICSPLSYCLTVPSFSPFTKFPFS